MDNNKLLSDFLEKVSRTFDVLGINDNKEEVVKNLVGSFLLNFSRLLATDEKIAPLLSDYSRATDSEPAKLFDFLDSKNVDYKTHFNSAQKETLESFVNELSQSLSPPKSIRS